MIETKLDKIVSLLEQILAEVRNKPTYLPNPYSYPYYPYTKPTIWYGTGVHATELPEDTLQIKATAAGPFSNPFVDGRNTPKPDGG